MLTGFASMRLPPVDGVVVGLPGDGAPQRCSGACAQGLVIVPWGCVYRLRLAGDASGEAQCTFCAPGVLLLVEAIAHAPGGRGTQGVSQPEGHSPPDCPLRHHGKSAVPPHKPSNKINAFKLYHYMRGRLPCISSILTPSGAET